MLLKNLRGGLIMVVLLVMFVLLVFLLFRAIAVRNEEKTDQMYKQREQKEREKAQEMQRRGETQYKHFESLYQEIEEKGITHISAT